MELTRFQRIAYQRFGDIAARRVHKFPRLPMALQRAHLTIRPEAYLATSMLYGLVAAAAGIALVFLVLVAAVVGAISLPLRFIILLVPAPVLLGFGGYLGGVMVPDMTARARAKDIEARLPYALNYLSTMANAGATPERMFASLAKQDIYGEVANEAAWIDRDVRLLGVDMLTAMNKAIDRSPSPKFQDLVQGIITVLTSGGDLKEYLMAKAEQFLVEGRQENQRFMDSMGVMAESFVVVVVAAPLFLIVILSVMSMFGSDADQVLQMGYLLVVGLLPIAQAGFVYTIKSMTPET